MIFLGRLVVMRTLTERRLLSMSVAGLRRTHEGDHQNAKRSDHPHPNHWLLTVLSALEIALHLIFRASICLAHPGLQAKPRVAVVTAILRCRARLKCWRYTVETDLYD
jgi:hypothetical protein